METRLYLIVGGCSIAFTAADKGSCIKTIASVAAFAVSLTGIYHCTYWTTQLKNNKKLQENRHASSNILFVRIVIVASRGVRIRIIAAKIRIIAEKCQGDTVECQHHDRKEQGTEAQAKESSDLKSNYKLWKG